MLEQVYVFSCGWHYVKKNIEHSTIKTPHICFGPHIFSQIRQDAGRAMLIGDPNPNLGSFATAGHAGISVYSEP